MRKKGLVLGDEDGSFYVSDRFSWKTTVRQFFDAYHKICERKQVAPLYQESALTSSLKVPYARLETVNLFHDGVVKRLFQFRDRRIPPFDSLSPSPTAEELRRMIDGTEDRDVRLFLEMVLLVDGELRRYVARLDELEAAYQSRLDAFAAAYAGTETEDAVRRRDAEAKRRIEAVLSPYIAKLKKIGALPTSWHYSYRTLPLTEEGRRYLSVMTLSSEAAAYWDRDELPLKSVREAALRREREIMERKRREDARAAAVREAARKREAAKPVDKDRFELSGPSRWERFDKRIRRTGDWFARNMDDITDWMVSAWIVVAILFAVAVIVSAWIREGFFIALIVFLVGAALLSSVLAAVAGFVALAIKKLGCIPIYILRFIFYRGWTFVLTLVLAGIAALRHFFPFALLF